MGILLQTSIAVLASALAWHLTRDQAAAPQRAEMVVVVRPSADEVGVSVGELVLRASQEAIAAHGRFTLALSGGSLPKVSRVHARL